MRRVSEPDAAVSANPLMLTSDGMIWLGVAVLLAGIGWFKNLNIVLLLAYLMFALLVVNGFFARAQARRVVALRQPTPPIYAGETATTHVTVTNTGTRPATVSVEDRTGGEPVLWLVPRLAAQTTTTCTTRRVFPTRGRFASVPVRVSAAFPFGLLQYDQPGGTGPELLVLPTPGAADPDGLRQWVLRYVGGDGRARKVLRRVTSDQADVRGVRPYRPGDPIRTIHWRSSARRRELMVREYDAAPAPELVLVVEPWLPTDPTPRQRENLEAALSLAVTVVRTWSRVYGTRLTVAVAGEEPPRTIPATDEGVREALAPLAGVVGSEAFEPIPPAAFDRSLARAARVVVSSRRNSPYADALTRSTGRLFVAISPGDRLPWYQPPDVGIKSQRSEVRSQKSEVREQRPEE